MARGGGKPGARVAVDMLLARASQCHRAGDLQSADRFCREVLASSPRNV